MRSAVLRRAVAILCTLALLTAGFAHNVEHLGGTVATVVIQTDVGSSDDSPDSSKRAPIAIEHCHGCTMVATAVLAPSVLPLAIATELPVRGFAELRPHTRIAETPPPISLI